MEGDLRDKVTNKLIDSYSDVINVRGIIVEPPIKDGRKGKVHFNIMDSSHPDFGKQTKSYIIDEDGTVTIT